MRIVLFGLPEFGTICLNTLVAANKNVVAHVLPPRSHPTCKAMKAVCDNLKVPTIVVRNKMKDTKLIEELKSYKADVFLIASYPRLLPPEIYNIPPLGTINCHPSLLPDYRGPNPYFHVLYNGEKQTGITFHYTDDTYDTGDIIYQEPFPIHPDETLGSLFINISNKSSMLYLHLVNMLEKGEKLPRIPQPELPVKLHYASEVPPDSPILRVNWNDSAERISRLVKATNPFFGTYSFYRGELLRILAGDHKGSSLTDLPSKNGSIVLVTEDQLAIKTSSGLYFPTVVQFGLYYLCDIKEFIKRNNPKVGEMLN